MHIPTYTWLKLNLKKQTNKGLSVTKDQQELYFTVANQTKTHPTTIKAQPMFMILTHWKNKTSSTRPLQEANELCSVFVVCFCLPDRVSWSLGWPGISDVAEVSSGFLTLLTPLPEGWNYKCAVLCVQPCILYDGWVFISEAIHSQMKTLSMKQAQEYRAYKAPFTLFMLVGIQQMPISLYFFDLWGITTLNCCRSTFQHKSLLFGYGVQYNASTFFSSFCSITYTPTYLPLPLLRLPHYGTQGYPQLSVLQPQPCQYYGYRHYPLPNSDLSFPAWPRHWFSGWLSHDA